MVAKFQDDGGLILNPVDLGSEWRGLAQEDYVIRIDARFISLSAQPVGSLLWMTNPDEHLFELGFDEQGSLQFSTQCYDTAPTITTFTAHITNNEWHLVQLFLIGKLSQNCDFSRNQSRVVAYLDGQQILDTYGMVFPANLIRTNQSIANGFVGKLDYLNVWQYLLSEETTSALTNPAEIEEEAPCAPAYSRRIQCDFISFDEQLCGPLSTTVTLEVEQETPPSSDFKYGMYVWTHKINGFGWYFPLHLQQYRDSLIRAARYTA